jgi:hypothetical protein
VLLLEVLLPIAAPPCAASLNRLQACSIRCWRPGTRDRADEILTIDDEL